MALRQAEGLAHFVHVACSRSELASWIWMAGKGWSTKDPQSPYVGGRTLKWLKVKQPRYREGERGWEPKRSGP